MRGLPQQRMHVRPVDERDGSNPFGRSSEDLALLGTTDRYYINWERSAVQGKACKGDAVVRHIPVSGQLLSKLRARVAADLLEAPWQTLMGSQLFTRDRD